MDPVTVIGVVSSIIAIIQLAGQLVTLTGGYIGGVVSASEEIEDLQRYLQSFSQLLETLKDCVEKNPQLESLGRLSGADGSLEQCLKDLKALGSKLDRPEKNWLTKKLKNLIWPLKSNEVYQFITRMESYERLFNLALGLDHLTVAQETNRLVQGLHYEATAQATLRQKENMLRQNMEYLYSGDKLGWLYMGPTDTKHQEISSSRQKETGKWFLRSPEFLEFVREKNPHGSMLRAYGIGMQIQILVRSVGRRSPRPRGLLMMWIVQLIEIVPLAGTGKTYVTSLVIDHLRGFKSTGVAYIYFDYKDIQQHEPAVVLASLVKQLVSQGPQVPPKIEALRETIRKEGRRANFEELYATLIVALTSFSRAFLVFDALDECKLDHQLKLLPLLKRMAKDRFYVFLTSRPSSGDINLSLADTSSIEISATEEDIRIYIKERLDEHPQARDLFQSAQCYEITSDLLACTAGIFLLVRFHINYLVQLTTAAAIMSRLAELAKHDMKTTDGGPGPLDFIYDRAIENIYNQHEDRKNLAFKVLSWLVKAKRTLTLEEIQVAVSVNHHTEQYEPNGMELPNRTTLLDVCASLVTIDEHTKTVRLVHYTAQEYLVRKSVLPKDADLEIALVCITYLSSKVFELGACKSNQDHLARVERYPFLEYAARYLSSHIQVCKENSTKTILLKFLHRSGNIETFQQVHFLVANPGYYYNRYPRNRSPLHIAACIGHSTVTWELLERGDNLWAVDSDNKTALHCAAHEGHVAIARLLLEKAAGVSAIDHNILHKTAGRGRRAAIRLLAEKQAMDSNSPLKATCQTAIRLLMGGKGLILSKDRDGRTPLHWAADKGHEEVVKLLIEDGASMTAKDNRGETALHSAARVGRDALVRLLVEKGADVSAKTHSGQTALRVAAERGYETVIQVLLEKGAEIIAADDAGVTSLHTAVFGRHEAAVRLLVENGIDINVLDTDGDPPLHDTVYGGDPESMQMMISLGASIDIKNSDGRTVLHWAAYGGSERAAEILIDLGAETSVTDNDGRTPLHLAAYKGNDAVARLLMARNANVSVIDNDGKSPLHLAAHRGHEPVARLLIDGGADISVLDSEGDSAFLSAASKGHISVVQLLIDKGADILAQGRGGKSALHWAASRGDERALQLYIDQGIDISALDSDGKTALHWAADRARDGVVKILIEKGADMSILDECGKTALHWASYRGNSDVIELMIAGGADISVLDSDGKTAAQLASECGRKDVVQLLVGNGANTPLSSSSIKTTKGENKTDRHLRGLRKKRWRSKP